MHWSTVLVLTAGLAAPQANVTSLQFDSYTKAYHAVSDSHKPMLMILNPSVEQVSTASPITLEQLQADPNVGPLLDRYVVAVVDTGTEHGREVYRRFNSPVLPFAAVIDERLEKQVYRTDEPASLADVQAAVAKYKDGVPVTRVTLKPQPFGDCPNCRRNWSNF